MASAIIGGIIKNGACEASSIRAADKYDKARKKAGESFGIETFEDNSECIKGADIVLLAVKPNVFPAVAADIRDSLTCDQVVLSIMAGKSIADLEAGLGSDKKIVRAMPNTPALVGAGITGYCPNSHVTDAELSAVRSIIASFEAMADAAVADGMPRAQAYHFAAQTVLGSAKMVLETGRHPGELKDMVTSPAGTTIEGVVALEKYGMRSAVIEAVRACTEKARNM